MNQVFFKMSGAGNDFIVADNRNGLIPEDGRRKWIEQLCQRAVSVGADGVLLVEPPEHEGNFRMRYYNSDGGEAESCGNGARCIARFAHAIGAAPSEMTFETQAGLYQARVFDDNEVEIGMTDPISLRRSVELEIANAPEITVDYLNTGVPHAVAWLDNVEPVDVAGLGRAIRFHPAFQPAGTNANFVQVLGPNSLRIRTYERGVEGETLACGTGCVAAAALGAITGRVHSPVSVHTRGGVVLTIQFDHDGEAITNVRLRGEARIVYKAELVEPFMLVKD